MSASRAQRLAELFDRLLDLPVAERRRVLASECADDPALQSELERLLDADSGRAAAVLEAASLGARQPAAGELVAGRYRIVRKVGEGGMGVVFEAEQLEPRRRVALKCIRPGWLDQDAEARFRREAQALGRLQHAGIAQVFDAGVAAGEPPLPYLAMEFVDGVPLAEFARAVPRRTRLELLAAVGEAVGHAHERGVVHRDLKPANVLVETGSGGPRPRVLDFGVARLAGEPGTLQTRTHQIVGTLAYLSPEQLAHGSAIADTRSDVWSLGVTAYELLTGRLPWQLAGTTLAQAALLLRDTEPVRVDRLLPELRGDVATIVHKALAKDPARRYADAGAFAADLRRHLAAEPIAARPPSAVYVASRFVRRHRGLVLGLGAAFVALAVGLVVALVALANAAEQRDRAELRTGELRAMVRTLVRDVDHELEALPGSVPARRLLLEAGLRYAERMVEDAVDDPDPLLEVASLLEELSSVQGRPGEANLGDPAGALQTLDKALALVERAKRAAPDQVRLYSSRRRILAGRDSLYRVLGRGEERLANLQEVRREVAAIAAMAPGPSADKAAAFASAELGRYFADTGRLDEAVPHFEEAIAFFARALPEAEGLDQRDFHDNLVILWKHLGNLHDRRDDVPAARAAFERSVQLAEAAVARWPGFQADRNLASALRSLSAHCAQRRDAEPALRALERARALLAPHAEADRSNVDTRRLVGAIDFGIADVLFQMGRRDEAVPAMQRYLADVAQLVADAGASRLERDLLPGQHALARELAKLGRFADAERYVAEALAVAERLVAQSPERSDVQDDLVLTHDVRSFVRETCAADPDLAPAAAAAARGRAVEALAAQLELMQGLAARSLLDGRRQAMLPGLRERLERLRAAGR